MNMLKQKLMDTISKDMQQTDKQKLYKEIAQQVEAVVMGEHDVIANMANISALLFLHLPNINWAGFYLLKEEQLVLGPFQGKPACIRIPLGRGVCGTAASEAQVQIVQNVHQFEGHIACDMGSNSEIVLPIFIDGQVIGVLDVDSPLLGHFDENDQEGLQMIVDLLQRSMQ